MDAGRVIAIVAACMHRHESPWALAGGYALNAYGFARLTKDVDIVADDAARPALTADLGVQGFAVIHEAEGFTNFLSADPDLGRLDLIWVEGETSRRLLGEVRELLGPGGSRLPVPRPEHLVAMKVKAVRDAPSRGLRDLADLEYLLSLPDLDRREARSFFEKAGLLVLYDWLGGRHGIR